MKTLTLSQLGTFISWLFVFSGGFVLHEPSPYEFIGLIVITGSFFFGLRLYAGVLPLLLCLVLFLTGGVLSMLQASDLSSAAFYMAITGFLCLSSVFYACYSVYDTQNRMNLIFSALIASALVSSLLGIAGYFNIAGTGEFFTLYGRARGVFQDPNVFGPYLVLPCLILLYRLMTSNNLLMPFTLLCFLCLMFAVLLSFSRAAWGNAVLASVLLVIVVYITHPSPMIRARIILASFFGTLIVVGLIVVALSIPAIAELMKERANLSQSYDSGHLGRFGRHVLGMLIALDNPLGIGPYGFRALFPEEPHNVYLNAAVGYGWIGFFFYTSLVLFTLVQSLKVVLFNSSLRRYSIPIFCSFAVLCLQGLVIDTDHWRHFYMLLGLSWGLITVHMKMKSNFMRLKLHH